MDVERPTRPGWTTLDWAEWESKYREGTTPWDLGRPPPILLRLLEGLASERLRVLVPGAGFGHDAIAWAAAGHDVLAVDFAPSAAESARARSRALGVAIQILAADLFELPRLFHEEFDAVWEQTCFCAITPARRGEYVRAVQRVLRPGGVFYGLFWNHGRSAGPPWDVCPDDVRTAFDAAFEVESLAPVELSPPERSNEFLVVMRRRA